MEIAFFGLSANPPHLSHLRVAQEALKQVDQVWVSPSYKHPFDKDMISYEDRLEMTYQTFRGGANIKVVEIDKFFMFQTGEKALTYNILKFCKKRFGVSPKFLIGEDNAKPEVWSKFNFHQEIKDEFGLIVVKEDGFHSTQIRELVKNKQWEQVEKYCAPNVVKYLKEKQFY